MSQTISSEAERTKPDITVEHQGRNPARHMRDHITVANFIKATAGLLGALGLTIYCWPATSLAPGLYVDEGTITAFHLFRMKGFDYGHILHTYGPLSYLVHPKTIGLSSLLIPLVYLVVFQGALIVVLARFFHRWHSWAWSSAFTMLVMVLLPNRDEFMTETAFVLMLVLALDACVATSPPRLRPELMGALTGFFAFQKLSLGMCMITMTVIVAAGRYRSPAVVGRALGAFVAIFLATWTLLGGSIADLPQWLGYSKELIKGYTRSFGYEPASYFWVYPFGLLWLGFALALLSRTDRRTQQPFTKTALLVCMVLLVFIGKEAFTRNDPVHSVVFFTFAPIVIALLGVRYRSVVLPALTVSLVLVLMQYGTLYNWRPGQSRQAFADTVHLVKSAHDRSSIEASNRNLRQQNYGMPVSMRNAIGEHPVALDDYDATVAWAYDLDWKPLPVFQNNLAYTDGLDELNARAAIARGAPYILQSQYPVTDDKYRLHEDPRLQYEMMCRYRPIAADGHWEALAPTGNRCSSPRQIGVVTLGNKDDVASIPQPSGPDKAIYMSIRESKPKALDKLKTQLTKFPSIPTETLADGKSRAFDAATADGPLLVHVAATSGWTDEYRLALDNDRVQFEHMYFPLRVTLYEVTVD